MYAVSAYFAYLFISISVTIWVARALSRNGRVFLIDTFPHNEPLADVSLASENEIAETLRKLSAPACAPYHDGALKSALPITGDDGDLRTPRPDPRP